MDALEDTQSSLGVCCCCLAEGSYKDMMRPYTWIGQDEIYSTMLMDCFGIDITSLEVAPWLDNKRLICELCIARLREASSFKTQVEQAQKTYVDRLKSFNFRDITKPELMAPVVKLERLDDSEVDHFNDLVDDFAGDDDMSDILPAVTSRQMKSRKKLAKRTAARTKISRQKVLLNVSTLSDERSLTKRNLRQIVECSTAFPFKWRQNRYQCTYCKEAFVRMPELKDHVAANHKRGSEKIYLKTELMKVDISHLACRLCNTKFENLDVLKVHLSEFHDKVFHTSCGDGVLPFKIDQDQFRCHVCDQIFDVFGALNRHMNEHNQNYICPTCGKGFITNSRLKCHMNIHAEGMYRCEECDKIFDSINKLRSHIIFHHKKQGGVRHCCPHCGASFGSYYQRNLHMSEQHEERLIRYKCNLCERVFSTSSSRRSHVRSMHLKERNYECIICKATFFSKDELKGHSVKHSKDREYQCDVCKKAYARRKTLTEHMRIHNNDRRFSCGVCGLAFVQKCSLKSHLRARHPMADQIQNQIVNSSFRIDQRALVNMES